MKSKGEAVKRQVSAFLTTYQHVNPILTGTDLKTMGLKPGPQFKRLLDRLLDARLNGEIKTESEERDLVMKLAGLKTDGEKNVGKLLCKCGIAADREVQTISHEPAGCSKWPSSKAAASEEAYTSVA